MSRIQVSSSASGPANFTVTYNPAFYDAQDETYVNSFETLHGAPIHHKRAWDGRPRTLTWQGNPVGSNTIVNISSYFRSIEGEIRYFNFTDVDSANAGWPTSDTWKKARVVRTKASYRKGGPLIYDQFSVIIQPEQ